MESVPHAASVRCRACGEEVRVVRLAAGRGHKWWHVTPGADHAADPEHFDGPVEGKSNIEESAP